MVLALVYTAILIPRYPQKIDVAPPTKNAAVVENIPNSGSAVKKTKAPKSTKKIERNKYSYLKKVIAPYIILINKEERYN